MRKILVVLAHPDDEAFGPAGTIAKYARDGVDIHLLSATKGQAGNLDTRVERKTSSTEIADIREKELRKAASILGVSDVEFLGEKDGRICNAIYHNLADKIMNKIRVFSPNIVMTFDRLGISGHLDHIGVSMITTYAFLKTSIAQKLYYNCLPKEQTEKMDIDDYFVYFPKGYDNGEITTVIDVEETWKIKVQAMKQHKSQFPDVQRILGRLRQFPKKEYFILGHTIGVERKGKENDLFDGLV